VAATAVIVIAVQFADRPAERPVETTIAAAPTPAERPGTDATPLTPGGVPPPIPPRPPARVTGPSATTPRRAIVDDRPIQAASIETARPLNDAPMPPLARLQPIEPIGLSRLEASEIPAPAINIKLLAIEHLEIAPLTPPR
jgi:hypothetical protein